MARLASLMAVKRPLAGKDRRCSRAFEDSRLERFHDLGLARASHGRSRADAERRAPPDASRDRPGSCRRSWLLSRSRHRRWRCRPDSLRAPRRGNDNTLVGLSLPRNDRFSARKCRSLVSRIVSAASAAPPPCASASARRAFQPRARPRDLRHFASWMRSVMLNLRPCLRACARACACDSHCALLRRIIGGDDARDESVADHVFFAETGDRRAFDVRRESTRPGRGPPAGRPADRSARDRR